MEERESAVMVTRGALRIRPQYGRLLPCLPAQPQGPGGAEGHHPDGRGPWVRDRNPLHRVELPASWWPPPITKPGKEGRRQRTRRLEDQGQQILRHEPPLTRTAGGIPQTLVTTTSYELTRTFRDVLGQVSFDAPPDSLHVPRGSHFVQIYPA